MSLPPESEPTEAPEHIAAIDLGSNSFQMVVAQLVHGELRILDRLGEKVQLGAGLNSDGELDEAAQQRALDCLSRFHQRIADLAAENVQIVGTNALRVAKNRKVFLRRAEEVMGFPIEIISGREEARLIYLGVSHSLADDAGKRLVIDIGGGSTELILGERFESQVLESLHMGCVSFRDKYFPNGKLTGKGFNKAVTQASRELLNVKHQYLKEGWNSCVGSSGSIKAIFQALAFMDIAHEEIDFSAMKTLRDRLLKLGDTAQLSELGVTASAAGNLLIYGLTDPVLGWLCHYVCLL